jgi:3-deoxy-D-manno-octulosonate 8-phosphate phosphatase (KDO 8-P phosphatase)
MQTRENLLHRAAAIKLVVMDVDGVLTRGEITYTATGDEIKAFNVKDGLGISKAAREGLQLGIITARESAMVARRAQELGIQHVVQLMKTKLPALEKLSASLNIPMEQILYIGDDLPDIPALEAAGLSACPADAAPAVRSVCTLISNFGGGNGAIREILEFILEARTLIQA